MNPAIPTQYFPVANPRSMTGPAIEQQPILYENEMTHQFCTESGEFCDLYQGQNYGMRIAFPTRATANRTRGHKNKVPTSTQGLCGNIYGE